MICTGKKLILFYRLAFGKIAKQPFFGVYSWFIMYTKDFARSLYLGYIFWWKIRWSYTFEYVFVVIFFLIVYKFIYKNMTRVSCMPYSKIFSICVNFFGKSEKQFAYLMLPICRYVKLKSYLWLIILLLRALHLCYTCSYKYKSYKENLI